MSQWKETHRGLVFPWNCDNYGHMNVRFYWDHFDDSAFQTWTVVGCPPALFHDGGIHAVTGRNTINYVSETTAGTMFVITAGVTRIGNRSVSLYASNAQHRDRRAVCDHERHGSDVRP